MTRKNIFVRIKNVTLANPLLRSLALLFTCVPPLTGIVYTVLLAASIIWARISHADLEMGWFLVISVLIFPAYSIAALIVAFVNQRLTGKYLASGLLILEAIILQILALTIILLATQISNKQSHRQQTYARELSKSIIQNLSVTGLSIEFGPPLGPGNDAWFGGEFRGGIYSISTHLSLNVRQAGNYVVWLTVSSNYDPQDFLNHKLGNTASTQTAHKFTWPVDLPAGPQIIAQTIPFTDIDPQSPYNYLWLKGGKSTFKVDVFRALTMPERLHYFGEAENSMRKKLARYHETISDTSKSDLEPVVRGNYFVLPVTLAQPVVMPGHPNSTPVQPH